VTDHRIGLTLYRLDAFLDGDIQEMVEGLRTADEAERLARGSEGETNGRASGAPASAVAGRA